MRSEDAVRRAFQKGAAEGYDHWLHAHLNSTYEELLREPWILDMDGTVKPLDGHQEQAVRGYNPTKHGRPSQVYQTYFIAAIRMVLEVEVQAGNQTASKYAQPGLWAWLDQRPREQWPKLVRGDIGRRLAKTAGRLSVQERWRWLLRFIFRDWLKAKVQNPADGAFLPPTALANCRI